MHLDGRTRLRIFRSWTNQDRSAHDLGETQTRHRFSMSYWVSCCFGLFDRHLTMTVSRTSPDAVPAQQIGLTSDNAVYTRPPDHDALTRPNAVEHRRRNIPFLACVIPRSLRKPVFNPARRLALTRGSLPNACVVTRAIASRILNYSCNPYQSVGTA